MGAGKTVVGQALANRLGLGFLDLDEVIEQREKRPIAQIFQESGEAYFRQLEKSLVTEFSRKENLVIACGGGVVLDQDNIINLKQKGIVVYLKAGPEVILERTKGYLYRPLLNVPDPKKKIEELLNFREPLYQQADFIVDTSMKDISQVVEEIIKIIKND